MASKLICFVAVLCALQHVQASAVQKRSIIDDIKSEVEKVAQEAQQKAADAVSEVSSLWDQIKSKVSEVISSASANLNAKAQEAKDKIQEVVSAAKQIGANIGTCVSEGLEEVNSVNSLAYEDLQTCVKSAEAPLEPLKADIANLADQSEQLVKDIPADLSSCKRASVLQLPEQLSCYVEVGNTYLSKGLLMVSSIAYDLSEFKTQLEEASQKIVKCGTDEVGEALKKYKDISESVQTCVFNGPSTE
ncbi:hypothetical protein B7P43_G09843 [Cryptotermes secundus]|uniref:Protein TsetseEP domain-containing protein n=1 Tax=Cryptotermes secundus TaxID=105785 RepID=A0A2J7PC55_9NEOP|nr:uncharacterized protein LOC111874930 [Cryptotermes secundus]PNF13909.1 hypothetical protein B7P43_G09843 [Cryptotermes secundus]